MSIRSLKRLVAPLVALPMHPQWLMRRNERAVRTALGAVAPGQTVLDIGCSDGWARSYLRDGTRYIGLDYPATADHWYFTRPAIYGDAHHLPVQTGSIDTVLLFDVLEHLERPREALAEIARVLRDNGRLLLHVPFLYPTHDAPRDFTRFTRHGLIARCSEAGLMSASVQATGTSLQSVVILANLALAARMAAGLSGPWYKRLQWSLLAPLTALVFILFNFIGWLDGIVSDIDDLMPVSWLACFSKRT